MAKLAYLFPDQQFAGPHMHFREFSISVNQGQVTFRVPARMSRVEFAEFEEVMALIMRSVKRGVQLEKQGE